MRFLSAKAKWYAYPFHFANVEGLGRLFYPIVQVQLKTLWGWQSFDFLVDTGADISMLPSIALSLFGLRKQELPQSTTYGVGNIEIGIRTAQIPIKIGDEQLRIRAAITDEGNTPFLLGKKDIFDTRFSLYLDSQKQQTVLIKR